jgi:hypothetical protein
MSANFLNQHIIEGEPLGSDAGYEEIAEFYTQKYIELAEQNKKYKEALEKIDNYKPDPHGDFVFELDVVEDIAVYSKKIAHEALKEKG